MDPEDEQGGPTSTKAADVVAVLNGETFEQVFPDARPLTASIFEVADVMEHPIEDGSKIADHVVFQPVEIDLPLLVVGDVSSVFAQVRQVFRDRTMLTVQTRAASYDNMLIFEMPHDETAEMLDGVAIAVRLRQAIIVTAQYGGKAPLPPKKVKAKRQASTVKRGTQQPAKPPPAQEQRGSVLYRLSKGKPI